MVCWHAHLTCGQIRYSIPMWIQGRWKQSADGQAQFDVNDEIGNNSRALRAAKFGPSYFQQ